MVVVEAKSLHSFPFFFYWSNCSLSLTTFLGAFDVPWKGEMNSSSLNKKRTGKTQRGLL
eukprot:m.11145 g.11145  ORF g.11145 m.11145 type:complete len:59 (-) comp6822_c0_seq1:50-226(-)